MLFFLIMILLGFINKYIVRYQTTISIAGVGRGGVVDEKVEGLKNGREEREGKRWKGDEW